MSANTHHARWSVTIVAMGATVFFAFTTVLSGIWGGMQYQALQSLRIELGALDQRIVSLTAEIDQYRAITQELAPAPIPEPMTPPHQQTPIPSTDTDTPESVESIMPDDPYQDIETLSAVVNKTENMEGEALEALIQTSIDESFGVQYGDFLDHCNLTAEKRAQIEEWLREYMAAHIRMGMKATQNRRSDPNGAMHQLYSESNTNTRVLMARLEKFLSLQEMEDWHENERTMNDRLNERYYDRLLEKHAGSMSEEGRVAVIEIIARETSSAQGYIQGTLSYPGDVTATMMQGLSAQIQGIVNAREPLADILSPADLQAYDLFVEEIRRRDEMMGRVIVSPELSPTHDSMQ